DVPLEGGLVLRRADPHPQEREPAAHSLDDAQIGQCVPQLDRVVVVLTPVEDAAHARTEEEVLVGQDLVPELLDGYHFGEEAVAADVEQPTVALHGAADAPE